VAWKQIKIAKQKTGRKTVIFFIDDHFDKYSEGLENGP